MKIKWHQHPRAATEPLLKIEEEIFQAAVAQGVLVSLGSWFRADKGVGEDMFIRATFASAPSKQITEATKRLGDALRKVFQLEI
jgi:aromatic amino acid aminotransferase I